MIRTRIYTDGHGFPTENCSCTTEGTETTETTRPQRNTEARRYGTDRRLLTPDNRFFHREPRERREQKRATDNRQLSPDPRPLNPAQHVLDFSLYVGPVGNASI